MEDENLIIHKLDDLKKELDFIKEHLMDITLTQDDIHSLSKAEDDLKKGKTRRL